MRPSPPTFRCAPLLSACVVVLGLVLQFASSATAYDSAHLKRLLADGRCPGCDLSGADIVDEDLRKAYLPGADLSGANLTVTNMNGADLSGANLAGADLSGTVLQGTIFYGANLTNAGVTDADFTNARLSGADVTGANMARARGANLTQAKGVPPGLVQDQPPPAQPPPKPPPPPEPKLYPAPGAMKDQRLGTLLLLAIGFCPAGTLEANGALLKVQSHTELFSLFGTTYGGDGRRNFSLPDLRQSVPMQNMRYCIVADGTYPDRP